MPEVHLPDGSTVWATAIAHRDINDPVRDFGLYLDPAWKPDWPADLIDWPDFGTPAEPDRAFEQISKTYARISAGEHVEIGCIGGMGRTGTVLACFAVMCGLSPGSAIDWVRARYDHRAIETAEQEQWVSWFATKLAKGDQGP